ncbi:hypothetical protein G3I40_30320, partial [Streptomyces sp. SID14478]|nr:hypothetical protein [Streptomyces sp. SID14478]
RPSLPPRGGPRAELPGGNPQPRVPSWSDENAQPHLDAPRGHDEPDSTTQFPPVRDGRQGPGSTAEFARPDFDAPQPGQGPGQGQGQDQGTGQYVRSDVFGGIPNGNGAPAAPANGFRDSGLPNRQDPSHTGQFERPAAPRQRGDAQDFPPAPPRPSGQDQGIPAQPVQQDYLPPAGPGDGRTPLYDTLETNWFHGQQNQQNQAQQSQGQQHHGQQGQQGQQHTGQQHQGQYQGQHPNQPQQQGPSLPQRAAAPQRPQASAPAAPARQAPAPDSGQNQANWRQSPNDELMRQAERVRKPAAGGVTVSGLPRRVPRANLVAGTAQEQQQNQSGPQVSRAPEEVRGRLTNLRRGIQQGRDAGTGQTGSYPRPTHQQER